MAGLSQDDLKVLFRQAELDRRSARRQIILNHVELEQEVLTPEDREVDKKARSRLQAIETSYQTSLAPKRGYWKTLWSALLGRA